jgi:hypothetical protein
MAEKTRADRIREYDENRHPGAKADMMQSKSGQLRRELADIDRQIAEASSVAETERSAARSLALVAVRGDTKARKAAGRHEALAVKWTRQARRLSDAKVQLEAELHEALEGDRAAAAEERADKAKRFAGELEKVGVDVDRALRQFAGAFADLDDLLSDGRGKHYNVPSREQCSGLMERAFYAALSHLSRRLGLRPQPPGGRSFADLGRVWADAVKGGTVHILQPKPAPVVPNEKPAVDPRQDRTTRPQPKQIDPRELGVTVYENVTAMANAHAQMQKGPIL